MAGVNSPRAAEILSATWKTAAEMQGFRELAAVDSSLLDVDHLSSHVPQMDNLPFLCPSCLVCRGEARHVGTVPNRPDIMLVSVLCPVCGHAWSVARKPRLFSARLRNS